MKISVNEEHLAGEIAYLSPEEMGELKNELLEYDLLLMEGEELRDFDEGKVKGTLRILFGLRGSYSLADIVGWVCERYGIAQK